MSTAVTNAEQFQRTLTVLAWFRNHPDGTFMEAAADLRMKTTQIKHELHQITLCGLPGHYPGSLVEVSMDRMRATVEYTAGLDHPVRLSPMEAGVVLLSLEAIRSTLPADKQPAVASASAKIQRVLPHGGQGTSDTPDEAGEVPAGGVEKREVAEPSPTILALRTAIDERRMVAMLYHSVSSDSFRRRHVRPDYLGLIDGETYLWAREENEHRADQGDQGDQGDEGDEVDESVQKRFAVSRIDDVTLGEEGSAGAAVQPTIDREDPFDFAESEEWARVRVRADHAWMLEYYPMWLVDGDGDDANDGDGASDSEFFDVYLPNTGPWTVRLLTAFSQGLRAVEPLTLAEEVRQRAEDGLNAYAEHLGVKPSQP